MLRRRVEERRGSTWKRYRVRGSRTFQDHEPGETFTAILRPSREAWAVRNGYLEILETVDLSLERVPRTLPAGWDAEISADAGKRAEGDRRLSTLEREEVATSGVH